MGAKNGDKKVSMAKAQVTIPLDIPEVRVLKSEMNKAGELIITVESTKETTVCRRCGRVILKFHGYASWVELRYLLYSVTQHICAIDPDDTVVSIVKEVQRPLSV